MKSDKPRGIVRWLGTAGLCLGLSAFVPGCVAHARGTLVYDHDAEYVDAAPDRIEYYPRTYYRGEPAYLVDGRWYYRSNRRWVVFHDEPRELRDYRVHRAPAYISNNPRYAEPRRAEVTRVEQRRAALRRDEARRDEARRDEARRAAEHRANARRMEERRAAEHRADERRAAAQRQNQRRAEEHRAEEHRAAEQRASDQRVAERRARDSRKRDQARRQRNAHDDDDDRGHERRRMRND